MTTTIREKIYINLKSNLKNLLNYEAHIGVDATDAAEKKLYYTKSKENGRQLKESQSITLKEVAAIHEFGCPSRNIPERSFLRETVILESENIKKTISIQIENVLRSGTNLEIAVKNVANDVLKRVQERILNKIPPHLKTETIEKKGHDTPLIDTEQLFDSIKSEVVKKGGLA
ncbi:MAG: hypothetical protein DCC88_00345 [Spirobacillus cienkowskii]|uniref:Uncharacterized protein n=1 Tax=Spirobacillus cienkowskii TaxID=495820 RepID=A0A369KVL9_9BACT|nr:MAG: hypothetical protein DCC88_00345 [Spirobacillus cienkowskii]